MTSFNLLQWIRLTNYSKILSLDLYVTYFEFFVLFPVQSETRLKTLSDFIECLKLRIN